MPESLSVPAAFKRVNPAAKVQAAGLTRETEKTRTDVAFVGQCPSIDVVINGVKMRGLLDTGSQVTLMQEQLFNQHFSTHVGLESEPTFLTLKAANGLNIPYIGYATMDFDVEGVQIPKRGIVVVKTEGLTNPLIIGMNVISACWSAIFQKTGRPPTHMHKDRQTREVWNNAFTACQRAAATQHGALMGYVWPAARGGIRLPARSEIVVWARARGNPNGAPYCGLVEGLPESHSFGVARAIVQVTNGRFPIRLCNVNPFEVSLGRYQKLGQLFRMEETEIHGQRDLSLATHQEGVVEVGVVDATDGDLPMPSPDPCADREDLTTQQKGELQTLLAKWGGIFAKGDEDFGRTDIVQHQIPTGEAAPIRQRFRPLPPTMYKEMRSLLADMLEKDIIRESSSPWAAPIVMVRKKSGEWRFCVDFRKLNAVTHKDAFPLPRIEETLTSLAKAEWFSTLDLASGYWQVEVHPADREKTAFATPLGLYEFNRMPFGLCNAPATFQRLMQRCLSGLTVESVLVYLDDIIIYSANFTDHLKHLNAVFHRLWKHGLKLRVDKCSFLQPEVGFLGHIVTRRGVKPDPAKIEAVQNWPVPTTIKDIRAFLGLAGYYRRFVAGFAKIARPLNALLTGVATDKKAGSRQIIWTDECQNAFQKLKTVLVEAPVLAYADFTLPFRLYTDASNQGLGAVLAQVQDGVERVVAYASRSLHPTERNDANYSSFKLELLALKWAITEKFRDYLMGSKCIVFTDNNPVAHLQTARLGATEQRWVAQLASYDFEVKYRSGRENGNADSLSRVSVPSTCAPLARVCMLSATLPPTTDATVNQISSDWKTDQQADADLRTIARYVTSRTRPRSAEWKGLPGAVKRLLNQAERLSMRDGVLCRQLTHPKTRDCVFQIVCPAAQKKEVWKKYHEAAGHAGVERTVASMQRNFFWVNMESEVREMQQNCMTCSLKDKATAKAPLHPISVSFPLEIVAMDFLSLGRPQDPYPNILVMTDLFTRYAWAVPTRDQTAVTTARALWSSVIMPFGCPMRLHSDQGPNFESAVMYQLCELYAVSKSRTTPYHPAGNGMVERMNQTLLKMLRTLTEEKQSRWHQHLPELLQVYNNTPHGSTGFAPAYLMFGRHLRLPVDASLGVHQQQQRYDWGDWVANHHQRLSYAYQLAKQSATLTAAQQKLRYDQQAKATPLLIGERVWRQNHRHEHGKLGGKWNPEPYVIIEHVGNTGLVYKIRPEKGGKEKTLHRNALKPCLTVVDDNPVCVDKPAVSESEQPDPPIYGFWVPAPDVPVDQEPQTARRTARENSGRPPERYSP